MTPVQLHTLNLCQVKPVLTADEYRRVDKAFDGDLVQAMDRAGYAVALAAVRAGAGYGKRVVVLAGPGNNGGDGYVAARYLKARGADVVIEALGDPKTPESKDAAAKAKAVGIRMRSLSDAYPADVVVDALFGGGVRSGMPESVLSWIDTRAPVVAVDYPTGLDPSTGEVEDTSFSAAETVTFSTLKTSHLRGDGPDFCGVVTVADIGIHGGEPCMYLAEESDAPRPTRPRSSHKWSSGAVLVVGGSSGIVGAAVFAGRSALNYGAGSVVVASPREELVHQLAPQLPTFSIDDARERLDRFDVVVAGPGLAERDAESIAPLLRASKKTLLDAGALTERLVDAASEGGGEVIITPHQGEFRRIAGMGGGAYSARAFARTRGVTVLLKGNPTLISDGDRPILVTTGGPELASIGTGDVLAGMIGALWARGLNSTAATVSGAYWHGMAGSDLAERGTVTADALVDHIKGFAW